MVGRIDFVAGEPCWADVSVRDVAAAERFYQSVFGWGFETRDPDALDYLTCFAGEEPVAAIYPAGLAPDLVAPGWTVYFATADVTNTIAAIEANGGTVGKAPLDTVGAGRLVLGFDPAGAAFGVWQGRRHIGFGLRGAPGGYAWAELYTSDPGAADAFYRELFGYEQRQIGDGAEFDYTVWNLGGRSLCGRMRMPASMGESRAHWLVYFAVEDVDAICGRVVVAGGSIEEAAHDSPYGRFSIVRDPDGSRFSVIDLGRATAAE